VPDSTAQLSPSPEPPTAPWLLGPDQLRAIHADDRLRDRLGAGEWPAEDDPDPVAGLLGAWLREVANGGTR
jgi:hypothetical protein